MILDPKIGDFLAMWYRNGGQEARAGQLLPLAEAAGVWFGQATTLRGKQTLLGWILSGAAHYGFYGKGFEVGGLVLMVKLGRVDGSQFYRIESIGVHLEAFESADCPTCGHPWREARAGTAAVNRLS